MASLSVTALKLRQPILATLLADRGMSGALLMALGAHLSATALGWPGFDCPIRASTGVPCPGCGLSRASTAMLHGQWGQMAQYHVFAPLFLIAFIFIGMAAVLPKPAQMVLAQRMAHVEQRTGMVAVTLIIFVMYWLGRLLWLRESFVNLILK